MVLLGNCGIFAINGHQSSNECLVCLGGWKAGNKAFRYQYLVAINKRMLCNWHRYQRSGGRLLNTETDDPTFLSITSFKFDVLVGAKVCPSVFPCWEIRFRGLLSVNS